MSLREDAAETMPPPASALTRTLAEFVANETWERIPPNAVEQAKRGIADSIGGALAAVDTPPAKSILELVHFDKGPCRVWGTSVHTTERNAALANGAMAHVHDIDDTNESMRGHPSIPIVPAIFALATQAQADGRDLLVAYLLGVEIEAKLGRAVNMEHYERGWHTTSTLGSLGAAAACARLLRLDAQETQHALAIATSMACGLRANFGTMTKSFHAGLATHNGVTAARAAQAGLRANSAALEADEGFVDLFCGFGNANLDKATAGLGKPYDVVKPGLIYKIYPSCSLTHPAIDLLLKGMAEGEIRPGAITRVNAGVGYRCVNTLPYHRPTSGLEAKFSLEYCIAAALTYGEVGIAQFQDDAVNHDSIRAAYDKLHVYTHPDLVDRASVSREFVDIEIQHADGTTYHSRLTKPKGHPSNPLTTDELAAKFLSCSEKAIGEDQARSLWTVLMALEHMTPEEVARLL